MDRNLLDFNNWEIQSLKDKQGFEISNTKLKYSSSSLEKVYSDDNITIEKKYNSIDYVIGYRVYYKGEPRFLIGNNLWLGLFYSKPENINEDRTLKDIVYNDNLLRILFFNVKNDKNGEYLIVPRFKKEDFEDYPIINLEEI